MGKSRLVQLFKNNTTSIKCYICLYGFVSTGYMLTYATCQFPYPLWLNNLTSPN